MRGSPASSSIGSWGAQMASTISKLCKRHRPTIFYSNHAQLWIDHIKQTAVIFCFCRLHFSFGFSLSNNQKNHQTKIIIGCHQLWKFVFYSFRNQTEMPWKSCLLTLHCRLWLKRLKYLPPIAAYGGVERRWPEQEMNAAGKRMCDGWLLCACLAPLPSVRCDASIIAMNHYCLTI